VRDATVTAVAQPRLTWRCGSAIPRK
jgi:hypothetical protein